MAELKSLTLNGVTYDSFAGAGSGGANWLDPEAGEVFTVIVPAPTLTGITASYTGGDVAIGTALSALVGIVVTANYSDGTTKTVTDYTLSGSISEGSNTITVTYEGMTATFTVTGVEEEPEVTLSSISATYTGGNVAVGTAVTDLTGITVTAHYSDGSTAPVTGYTLSGTIAEGSNTITVSYGGKTTTFVVTGEAEEEEQIGQEGRAVIGNDGYVYLDVMTTASVDGWKTFIDRTVASSGFATFQIDNSKTPMVADKTSEVLCKDKFAYLGTSYSGIRNGTVSPEVQYGYGYDGAGGAILLRIPYSDYESVGASLGNIPAAIALRNRYIPFKLKDGYNTYSITEEAIDAATYYGLPTLTDGFYNGWLYVSNGGVKTGGMHTGGMYLCNYGGMPVATSAVETTLPYEIYYCNGDEQQRLYVRVPEGEIEDATTLDGWKAFLKSRLPIEWYGD